MPCSFSLSLERTWAVYKRITLVGLSGCRSRWQTDTGPVCCRRIFRICGDQRHESIGIHLSRPLRGDGPRRRAHCK